MRLGAGLDADGMLTEAAAQRGLDCLRALCRSGWPASRRAQVRAVATQTLREARNRNAFLLRAQEALGYPIEVISGREEARLIYAGVARLQPTDAPRLVIDIGGRSTEMILGQGRTPLLAESFQVGSVSLSMRFFGDGRLTESAFRAAQIAAGAELEEALRALRAAALAGGAGLVGHGRRGVAAAGGQRRDRRPHHAARACAGASSSCLRGRPHRQARAARRCATTAAPCIAGGLAILYTLATHFGIDALRPARGALRQGVIIDLRRAPRRRCATPSPAGHARRIGARAAAPLRGRHRTRRCACARWRKRCTQPVRRQRRRARRKRGASWAGPATLHEIGHDGVAPRPPPPQRLPAGAMSTRPGSRRASSAASAELVLGQRGGLRKIEPAWPTPTFAWQALCLRLAVIKCHARGAVDAERAAAEARRRHGAARASAPAWAESHPRTLHLLREEAETWARQGPLRLALPR